MPNTIDAENTQTQQTQPKDESKADKSKAESKTKPKTKAPAPSEEAAKSTGDEFQKTVRENSRTIAILTHIGSIFLGPIAPLLVYLFVSDPLVKANAKEVLNFEITLWVVLGISGFLTGLFFGLWFLIVTMLLGLFTGLLFVGAILAQLILPIVGAVQASEGKIYKYPLTFRLIK